MSILDITLFYKKRYFALQMQTQKSVKTAMDGSFRNFEKVGQDGLLVTLPQ